MSTRSFLFKPGCDRVLADQVTQSRQRYRRGCGYVRCLAKMVKRGASA